jgi:hypothetical protein
MGGTHAGFANKRPPRMTIVRHPRQWRVETHGGFPKKKLARGIIIRDSRHWEVGTHAAFPRERLARVSISGTPSSESFRGVAS